MRHGISGNKFGRNQKWREATLRDLVKALLTHDQITTTKVKAVEARKLAEKMITKGKKNTLQAKRQVFAVLCDHTLVSNLFNNVAPRFASRQGGYTRIIKLATNRGGDNAEMAILELTEKAPEEVKAPVVKGSEKSKVEDAQLVTTKGVAKRTAKAKPVKAEKKAAPVKKAAKTE